MSSSSVTASNPKPGTPPPTSLALFLAGLVAHNAAIVALALPLITPGYIVFLLLLSLLGAFRSYHARKRTQTVERDLLVGAIVLIVTFTVVQIGVSRFGRVLPLDFLLSSTDMSMIMALTLTATVACFFWLVDMAVLFAAVWAIAMLGLSATLNINVQTIVCFGLYLFAALFLMVHQHTLAQSAPQGRTLASRGPLLLFQLRTAGVLFAATFSLGVLVAIPLQMLGRNMSLTNILERLKVKPETKRNLQNKLRLVFDNPREFVVGLGPVTDDDTLLFQVSAPRPSYWRTRTFATCSGNSWTPYEDDGEVANFVPPRSESANKNVFTFEPAVEGVRTKTERIKAQVNPVGGLRTLVHLVEPRLLRGPQPQVNRKRDGTISLGGNRLDFAPPPAPYELEADVSVATNDDLNASSQDYPEEIKRRYLQEPDPGKLDELALEALGTVPVNRPYDRAEAIRRFVATRCTYSLEARACPPGRNPAEWFLNDSRVGYCDLYATAVTLLCRAAKIPARIATGFNAGEIDPEHPNAYNLRERNRHAWCEVYFTGYGWVAFDATALTTEATAAPIPTAPAAKTQTRKLPVGPLALAGIAVVGLVGVGAGELLRRRGKLPQRAGRSEAERATSQLLLTYTRALQLLRRSGAPRLAPMTVGEHLAQVEQALGSSVANAYTPLARLSERVLFGKYVPQTSELAEAERALQALQEAVKAATIARKARTP